MTEARPFVLVHGAFRGGFSFCRLRPLLEAHGHPTFAPTLPGAAEHHASARSELSLSELAHSLARFIELEDLRRVILVGHSQGGIVATAASELCHARLSELVFLDAPVPRPLERAVDLHPHGPPPALPARDTWIDPRPLVADDAMNEADAAWLSARLCPTPVGPSLDPLVLGATGALALPRHYLFCTKTPSTYPCAHSRARFDAEGVPYTWIEGGHDAELTQAPAVADALLAIARGEATPHA